ncbi:MAG: ribbon-helix-helix domain-containing protein [Candidatus Aenigmatarchaeota archaeon]
MKKRNSNIITWRVPEEITKKLDEMLKSGLYNTRTEILNNALRDWLGLNKKKDKK